MPKKADFIPFINNFASRKELKSIYKYVNKFASQN